MARGYAYDIHGQVRVSAKTLAKRQAAQDRSIAKAMARASAMGLGPKSFKDIPASTGMSSGRHPGAQPGNTNASKNKLRRMV